MRPRKAFSDQSKWQIFRAIWWFCVPPNSQASDAAFFCTYEEAVAHFIANVHPVGASE